MESEVKSSNYSYGANLCLLTCTPQSEILLGAPVSTGTHAHVLEHLLLTSGFIGPRTSVESFAFGSEWDSNRFLDVR